MMTCIFQEACEKNIKTSHWTCLKRLHRELYDLIAQRDRIQDKICAKETRIRQFYSDDDTNGGLNNRKEKP